MVIFPTLTIGHEIYRRTPSIEQHYQKNTTMAQITIDIPDDLAQRLAPFQNQFSYLFTRLIATRLLEPPTTDSANPNTSSTYQEILDFLCDRPTSAQIVNFKVSPASQSRLQTLLQQNRETALTAAETAEIELYQQLDTLIGFLKIRAYAALQATPQN
jgi:arsenate reductase-like glutaredoxin family protein